MLPLALGKYNGINKEDHDSIVKGLHALSSKLEETLGITQGIQDLAEEFADKQHSLFLGRGDQYPIAMEGALKLKEISYIHAEAYASGVCK
jgi:glucosamine--fructose-6-phosphate aminotransferase (isomerizing)